MTRGRGEWETSLPAKAKRRRGEGKMLRAKGVALHFGGRVIPIAIRIKEEFLISKDQILKKGTRDVKRDEGRILVSEVLLLIR